MSNRGIFESWAMRYFEMGIPVIPLDGKAAFLKNWQAWCERPQTAEEVEALVERYPHANIGTPLGLWALALDIDTDDPDVLAAAPPTPYRRIGKTGAVLFYRPDRTIASLGQADTPIELLNVGRQVVLVPSRHPDGMIYRWDGPEVDPTDLPPFPPDGLSRVILKAREKGVVPKRKKRVQDGKDQAPLTDFGRNNALVGQAYAKACDGKSIDEGAEELLAFDAREHLPPWFSDPTEPHRGRDPMKAARRMMERAIQAATRKGDIRHAPEVLIELRAKAPPSRYPQPRGLMRLFADYCELNSRGAQDALGLAGSISLMSAICSNRVITKITGYSISPITYVMALAPSGFGKETPQRALKEVLLDRGIVGSGGYKSGTSIIQHLAAQQTRLDLIDEASGTFATMGGKESYQSEMEDIYSQLWSSGTSKFLGVSSVKDGKNFGACWHPHVSMFAATTITGFETSISARMATKGLLPRFLTFCQFDNGEFKRFYDEEASKRTMQEIQRIVRVFESQHPLRPMTEEAGILERHEEGVRFDHEVIPSTRGAESLFLDMREDDHKFVNAHKEDSVESAFRARFAEHAMRLALLDTISQGLGEVTADSLAWGRAVVEASWSGAEPLIKRSASVNLHEKNVMRVLHYVQENGTVTRTDISRRFRDIPKRLLDEILKQLEDGAYLGKLKPETGAAGRQPERWGVVRKLL